MSAPVKRLGIVVGVDGSDASNAAVCWAAGEAAMRNMPLTLIYTYRAFLPTFPAIPLASGVSVWEEDDGRQVLEQAVKIAEDVVEPGRRLAIKSELKCSLPVPTLVDLSEEAAMVVVGNSGRGAVARGLLGSVSSGVVRSAHCPVAVIHDEDPLMPRPREACVVVGIDGSPASELATAIAFDEASHRGVELRAVHAWSDIEVVEFPGMDWMSFRMEAEQRLAERLSGWQERYPDVAVHRVVVADRPARRMIKEAQSALLVVLGSHGRGGLAGMLMGSVSNAVVHSTRTPVIVARPSKRG